MLCLASENDIKGGLWNAIAAQDLVAFKILVEWCTKRFPSLDLKYYHHQWKRVMLARVGNAHE